jgi:hypothetical protein
MFGRVLERTYGDGKIAHAGDIIQYGQSGEKYAVVTVAAGTRLRIWRIREPIPSGRPLSKECILPEANTLKLLYRCNFRVTWGGYIPWLRSSLVTINVPSNVKELLDEIKSYQEKITLLTLKIYSISEGVPLENQ